MKTSKMKNTLLLAVIFSVTVSFGQNNQAEKAASLPFIEVTGTAEKEVVPDEIYISITLKNKVVSKEVYTITSQEEKLKNSLKQIGIPLGDLFLSSASSEITRYKRKEAGVEESKMFSLKVSNATEAGKVFEALHNLNIKEAFIAKVDHSKIDSLRKEVRIAAIVAAKNKAVYLLTAIGEQIGKPLEITEQVNNFFMGNLLSNSSNTISTAENATLNAIEGIGQSDFEKLTIKFSYNIKYSIK